MTRAVDWLMVSRFALLIALCQLIPVPLVDGWVEDRLRRSLVKRVLADFGLAGDDTLLGVLADAPRTGCLGWVKWAVLWPVKKLLKSILWMWTAKKVVDAFSEQVHRALMVHAACEAGWLPERAPEVRVAMDVALRKADTRLIERSLMGVYRDHRDEMNQVVWRTTKLARAQARGERVEVVVEAAEGDRLGQEAREVGGAMASALRASGVVAEVLHFFELEMVGRAQTGLSPTGSL